MATKKINVAMDGATATVEVKEPPKKKCSITDVLPENVIALVKAAPNNDTIRNLLLAHLKISVPKEEDTFEKVQKWIEFNVEPPKKPKSRLDQLAESHEQAERERRANQVDVMVHATEREHGHCDFHRDSAGTGEMPINRAAIIRIASESDNPTDFFSLIHDALNEDSPDNYINMEVVEDTEDYDDHEINDTTDGEITITDEGKRALKEALRAADPALYQSLFGNT